VQPSSLLRAFAVLVLLGVVSPGCGRSGGTTDHRAVNTGQDHSRRDNAGRRGLPQLRGHIHVPFTSKALARTVGVMRSNSAATDQPQVEHASCVRRSRTTFSCVVRFGLGYAAPTPCQHTTEEHMSASVNSVGKISLRVAASTQGPLATPCPGGPSAEIKDCGEGIEAGPHTTCEFAAAVATAYTGDADPFVVSVGTMTYFVTCDAGHECRDQDSKRTAFIP
jgi:hypothetical protein